MWRATDARARARHWSAIERLLGALPPSLHEHAKLVEYELAIRYSDTGAFRDVFSGVETPPIVSIGPWLLDDLCPVQAAEGEEVERRLVLASILLAFGVHLVERSTDEGAFHDDGVVPLAAWAAERVGFELAAVVGVESATATGLDRIAGLGTWSARRDGRGPGPWVAPLQQLALAAIAAAGRPELADRVVGLIEDLAAGLHLRAQVATLDADLQAGRPTEAIATIARGAAIPLEPWPEREQVLGAMLLTGSLPALLEDAVGRLRAARAAARDLGLPTLGGWLDDAEAALTERLRAARGEPAAPPVRPLIERATAPLATALDMAERFLLADLSLRESWETHREGLLGAPEVASRFPAGIVLEILGRHGVGVTAAVDDFLAFTVGNGFRYYDHPGSDPDTDSIGVVLRLRRLASEPERHDPAIRGVLERLGEEVARSGAVPVWLGRAGGRLDVLALGEGCATVAAHLLLGLVELDRPEDERTVELGLAHVANRIGEVGLAANVNYPPFYALGILFRLLGDRPATRRRLGGELEARLARPASSPQDAALRTLACLDAGRPELVDRHWRATILRGQRMDGSWRPEPFAPAPNRGGSVTWYSSSTLTTALCYDALRRTPDRAAATGVKRASPTSVG